ncbi:hypothetical protein EIP86_003008 [Pleurotus ostreatoroseus]|nr:hypothetical protein EIP86_003008 [Pleurotus ostreatoroseus]
MQANGVAMKDISAVGSQQEAMTSPSQLLDIEDSRPHPGDTPGNPLGQVSMADSLRGKDSLSQSAAGEQEHPPQCPQSKHKLNFPDDFPRALTSITWRDGLTACRTPDGKYIVTSPNAPFIPEPILERITVMRQWDGYFGKYDPIRWPQILVNTSRLRWLIAVARKPDNVEDPRLPLWNPLLMADIVPAWDSHTFGKVSQQRRAELQPLVTIMSARAEMFSRQCGEHSELQSLIVGMEKAFDRLDYPSTSMDLIVQVACVQRCWLLADAWLEFHVHLFQTYHFTDPQSRVRNKPRLDLMGAFTNSPDHVQLMFDAGIPVWHYRFPEQMDITNVVLRVVDSCKYSHPDNCDPFPAHAIYQGFPGVHHLTTLAGHAHTYLGLDMISSGMSRVQPLTATPSCPTLQTSQMTSVPTTSTKGVPFPSKKQVPFSSTRTAYGLTDKKPILGDNQRYQPYPRARTPRGNKSTLRSKFESLEHELLPASIPAWKGALFGVDQAKDAPRLCPWLYWLPEAALMVTASKTDRVERYIRNWLRVREGWYLLLERKLLQQEGDLRPLRPREWREYLNMADWSTRDLESGTASANRKRRVFEVFERVTGTESAVANATAELLWFDKPWDPNCTQQTREIMWEIIDLGFRCELIQLDRHLVPDDSTGDNEHSRETMIREVFCGRPLIPKGPPTTASEGLGSADLRDRVTSLEALRRVLIRWPGAPISIRKSSLQITDSEKHLKKMERKISCYYVQMYWEAGGRPAIIPRYFPSTTVA